MTLCPGDLITVGLRPFGTAVWEKNLDEVVDSMDENEIAVIIKEPNDHGWIQVVTCRGNVGFIHRNNLRPV